MVSFLAQSAKLPHPQPDIPCYPDNCQIKCDFFPSGALAESQTDHFWTLNQKQALELPP